MRRERPQSSISRTWSRPRVPTSNPVSPLAGVDRSTRTLDPDLRIADSLHTCVPDRAAPDSKDVFLRDILTMFSADISKPASTHSEDPIPCATPLNRVQEASRPTSTQDQAPTSPESTCHHLLTILLVSDCQGDSKNVLVLKRGERQTSDIP
ncbi:hypothetical protein FA13DRAFT_1739236 [Coprinellus micaceus]|uniref:Uncharacterized protein n=1 Tax=Coprinellus micaceus TaxID=71717 RepID=A0A4Y7SRX3_COPMI|nr:hypothetical protein FA13DRAFT_1739236 [Coprinellus micaceus]